MAFFSSHSFMQETFGEHWAKSWRSQEEWETTWPTEASYPSGVGWSQLQCVAPCLCFVKGTAYSPPSKKNKTKRNSLPPRIQKLLYHLPRSFGTLSSSKFLFAPWSSSFSGSTQIIPFAQQFISFAPTPPPSLRGVHLKWCSSSRQIQWPPQEDAWGFHFLYLIARPDAFTPLTEDHIQGFRSKSNGAWCCLGLLAEHVEVARELALRDRCAFEQKVKHYCKKSIFLGVSEPGFLSQLHHQVALKLWESHRTFLNPSPVFPHFNAHKSPGNLLQLQSRIQQVWAQDSASLTSSQTCRYRCLQLTCWQGVRIL